MGWSSGSLLSRGGVRLEFELLSLRFFFFSWSAVLVFFSWTDMVGDVGDGGGV